MSSLVLLKRGALLTSLMFICKNRESWDQQYRVVVWSRMTAGYCISIQLRTGWRNSDSGSALYLAHLLRQKADLRNPEMTGHCAPRGYEVTSWCFCPWITGMCRDIHADIQRANCHSCLNKTFEIGRIKCFNTARVVWVMFTLTNTAQGQRESLSVYPPTIHQSNHL